MNKYTIINEKDNVGVALDNLQEGEKIYDAEGKAFYLLENINMGHKFALRNLACGQEVIKYGNIIGSLTENVRAGEHVHSHNLQTNLQQKVSYSYSKVNYIHPHNQELFFKGYKRPDGRVGVRNEIWIIPTVGCVNSLAQHLRELSGGLISGTLENIVSFSHPYGCSQTGEDQEMTRKALSALAKHPNCGGVLLVGLGCENSNIGVLKDYLQDIDNNKIRYLQSQDVSNEIEAGITLLEELANYAKSFQRELVSISNLTIGLKCGASDGLSGITANPLLGKFSDLIVECGGKVILTEVPEMFGAEQILMNRAESYEVFNRIVTLITDFKDYFINNNQTIYENPSPGNKEGGITTLEDKSLGCIQKAGHSEVRDVLNYGERVRKSGLSLLSSPGNDLVSSTALAVSGANLILFTTGRGTPFGSPVPTIKISSNSKIYNDKKNWIDFDAGVLLNKEGGLDELNNDFRDYILEVASGQKVKAEKNGYHDMAIFKSGVTL